MSRLFLGVDTSNYTTSLCISDGDKVIAEVRRLLPVKEGERGLRQSDALFHHTKALPELSEELFNKASVDRRSISAVGVSSKPRDVEGSYMPCFLAGVSYATAFANALDIPIYRFSHQCGHIAAAAVSGGHKSILDNDFISFHVSGGTTEVLYVTSIKDGLKCEIIGGTKDLNAGQAIDRCGVALGLVFPCGARMDEMSKNSNNEYSPRVTVKDGFCNLSGLENKCRKMINDGDKAEDICKYTFSYIASVLSRMAEDACKAHPRKPILFAGGVMSNTLIRSKLTAFPNALFSIPYYSCDNAFGISCLTFYSYDGIYKGLN